MTSGALLGNGGRRLKGERQGERKKMEPSPILLSRSGKPV